MQITSRLPLAPQRRQSSPAPQQTPEPPSGAQKAVRVIGGALAGMSFIGGPAMFASARNPASVAVGALMGAVNVAQGLQRVEEKEVGRQALIGTAVVAGSLAAGYLGGSSVALGLCAAGLAYGAYANW